MPDEINPTVPAPETPPSPPDAGKTPAPDTSSESKTFDETYVKKLRSEAAENRVKANELQAQLEALTAQFQGLEEKYKGQFEQRIDELKALIEQERTAREEADRRATRLQVATENGLPPELADRLHGDTLEELQEDAKRFIGVVKNAGLSVTAANHPGGKVPPPGAGSPPPVEGLADEVYKIIRQGQSKTAYE